MTKMVVNYSMSDENLNLEFIQYSFNEAELIIDNDIDRVELQFNDEQLQKLKELLVDKSIEKFWVAISIIRLSITNALSYA